MSQCSIALCAALVAVCAPAFAEPEDEAGRPLVDLKQVGSAAGDAVRQTREGLGDAALSPLEDLNMRKEPVPPLLEANEDPYSPVVDATCPRLAAERVALSSVLGPEPGQKHDDDRSLSGKVADRAASEALKTVASQARELIPYRGLVRKVSGADKHEKTRRQAFERGHQRRAYLKGLSAALNCDAALSGEASATAAEGVTAIAVSRPTIPDMATQETALPEMAATEPRPAYVAPPPPPPVRRPAEAPSALTLSTPSGTTDLPEAPRNDPPQWPPEG